MPELPDIEVYIEALDRRTTGQVLQRVRLGSPFLLRSVDPPLKAFEGLPVRKFSRLGKRIVFHFDGELYLVLHLMIAGRLHWRPAGAPLVRKLGLAAFDFAEGSLVLTEAGSKKRASLYALRGAAALAAHDPGGIDLFAALPEMFRDALRRENHTLKRTLTDPRLFSGIGNWVSDEILHHAKLSPVKMSQSLNDEECGRLLESARIVLHLWTERLRQQTGNKFPEKVTAFRPEMAVHGKFGKPCPVCGAPVQRIVYESNETNYCPRCQTGGKILADRALSRLLKSDWPRTLEELEEAKQRRQS
ncbi:MAG: Fpg/Nei family DNA glycosylase [Dongiaceae bacterium]